MNTQPTQINKKAKSKIKSKYISCKVDDALRNRIKIAAKREKRTMSNLINIIVEEYLDENEIRE